MLSKRYESTEVDRRTWLHVPSAHYCSVCDKTNIYTVSKLGKFAFMHGKSVNINQIVAANSKVSI